MPIARRPRDCRLTRPVPLATLLDLIFTHLRIVENDTLERLPLGAHKQVLLVGVTAVAVVVEVVTVSAQPRVVPARVRAAATGAHVVRELDVCHVVPRLDVRDVGHAAGPVDGDERWEAAGAESKQVMIGAHALPPDVRREVAAATETHLGHLRDGIHCRRGRDHACARGTVGRADASDSRAPPARLLYNAPMHSSGVHATAR